MNILSVTFHVTDNQIKNWNQFLQSDLIYQIDKMTDVEKFILSEVETDLLTEGKNYNFLLIFENQQKKDNFINNFLVGISQLIALRFGENVMVFATHLNPLKIKF